MAWCVWLLSWCPFDSPGGPQCFVSLRYFYSNNNDLVINFMRLQRNNGGASHVRSEMPDYIKYG